VCCCNQQFVASCDSSCVQKHSCLNISTQPTVTLCLLCAMRCHSLLCAEHCGCVYRNMPSKVHCGAQFLKLHCAALWYECSLAALCYSCYVTGAFLPSSVATELSTSQCMTHVFAVHDTCVSFTMLCCSTILRRCTSHWRPVVLSCAHHML
jgi:hypothetical protein